MRGQDRALQEGQVRAILRGFPATKDVEEEHTEIASLATGCHSSTSPEVPRSVRQRLLYLGL